MRCILCMHFNFIQVRFHQCLSTLCAWLCIIHILMCVAVIIISMMIIAVSLLYLLLRLLKYSLAL